MAFPSPGTPVQTQFASSVTSMAVNMPATVDSGDLLIALVEVRNSGTWSTVPSGWTEFGSQVGGGSVGKLTMFYKIADGTEDGGTATWIHSTGTTAIWQVIRVTDWDGSTAPEKTTSSGDATAANPPSLTPSWGAADTLWLAVAGHTAASTTAWSAGPSGYSGFTQHGASSGGAAVCIASAYYQNNAGSEDPGAYTVSGSNRFWAAATIAIKPAGGANTAPDVALDSPADTATGVGNPPDLQFTGTDDDADDITYQVQVDTVNTFDSGNIDIEFVSKNEVEANSMTLPTHQTGDLIVMFAARNGNNTAPTVPAGWTSVGVNAGTNCAVVVAEKVAASGSETSGTWTNADLLSCHVYRNADHITRHAGNTSGGLPSSTLQFPSITTMEDAGNSWGLRFGYISTIDGDMTVAPASFTNRSAKDGATTGSVGGHDTNGPVSSVGFATAALGGTAGDWITQTIEIVKVSGGGSGPLIDALSDTDPGFSNLDTGGDTDPFTSGEQIQYAVQSALMTSTTYYWRVRGKDPSGSNTWGDWSSIRSFQVTAAGATEKSVTETGSGADAIGILVLANQTDSGEGSDVVSVLGIFAETDSGSGDDALDLVILIGESDTGSGADEVSVLATIPISDDGLGADIVSILALLDESDSGSGDDAVDSSISVALSDAGEGSDALAILALLSLAETGSGDDALDILALLAQSDSATGADALEVVALISATDTASGDDALDILAMIAQSDSASASDAIGILALLAVSESANADDALDILNSILMAETGSGVDSEDIMNMLSEGETGSGDDAVNVNNLLSVSETGSGSDSLSLLALVTLAETASGIDAISISIMSALGSIRTALRQKGSITALSQRVGNAILKQRH